MALTEAEKSYLSLSTSLSQSVYLKGCRSAVQETHLMNEDST